MRRAVSERLLPRVGAERLLPPAYQRAAEPGTVLSALLDVMAAMHEPSEAFLASVEDLFAPYRAPERLMPFLVGWVAMEHVGTALPTHRLRELAARGADLARWRGTATGLCALLETVTGQRGFAVREPEDRPFHIVVFAPIAAQDQLPLVRRVVELEKPAAITAEVQLST